MDSKSQQAYNNERKAFYLLKEAILEKITSWKSSDFNVKPVNISI